METFFTSDTHFYHKNILNFEDRPYKTVEEMTEGMILTWNQQVKENDLVYHLGDLSLGNTEQTERVLRRLNGNIVLIKGNHDMDKQYKKIGQLGLLHDYHEVGMMLKHNKHQLWLTHYPFEIGLRPRKWSIHGHIHGNESNWLNQINVGVDSPHFKHKPFAELITMDELFEVMVERLPEIEERFTTMRTQF